MKNWWYFDIIGYVKLVLFMPKKSLIIIIILGLLVLVMSIVFWQFVFKEKEPGKVMVPEPGVSEEAEDMEPAICGDGKITGNEECDPNAIVIGCPAFEVCSLRCVCEGKIEEEPLVINDRHQEILRRTRENPDTDTSTRSKRRCQALTRKGVPCRNYAVGESPYCQIHQASNQNGPDNADISRAPDVKTQISDSLAEIVR